MHKTNVRRWPKVLTSISAISLILGFTNAPQVFAQSNLPTPSCNASGTSCSINFSYSGDYYYWPVPTDVRTISMTVVGAQGGRNGGYGAKLIGKFSTLPTGGLYIFVGGQGASGNGVAGGFNGGGAAGRGHGDEGSGGGASDIRTSLALTDRIAVAGGGGGTGGWVGGAGGSAGASGVAGGAGQGGAGLGATVALAGSGGAAYGTLASAGSAGASGVGGAGGSATNPGSTVAGGGGGGGGYFGGGGGGADTDPSGLDGGGGGGGSDYVNSAKINSVGHYQGFQAGDGTVTLVYTFSPSVVSFSAPTSPSNAAAPNFAIAFGQSITGFTADDMTLLGSATGCYVSNLVGTGASYTVTVSGCADGTLQVQLNPDTVTGSAPGPVRAVTTSLITLDRTTPEINTITKATSANNLAVFRLNFTEPVTGLAGDTTDFMVKGDSCTISSLTGSAADYVITISNCTDGRFAGLVLNQNTVIDAAGNLGPTVLGQTPTLRIDNTPPSLRITDVTSSETGASPTFVVDSDEPTTGLTSAKFAIAGTSTNCVLSLTELRVGLGWRVVLTGCKPGTAGIVIAANPTSDLNGNTGPTLAMSSALVTVAADATVNQVVAKPGGTGGAGLKPGPHNGNQYGNHAGNQFGNQTGSNSGDPSEAATGQSPVGQDGTGQDSNGAQEPDAGGDGASDQSGSGKVSPWHPSVQSKTRAGVSWLNASTQRNALYALGLIMLIAAIVVAFGKPRARTRSRQALAQK